MSYTDAVVDFLSKRQNLVLALEIVDQLELVKDKFQIEFWLALGEAMKTRLKRAKSKQWEIEMPDEADLCANWVGCSLYPLTVSDDQYYLGVGFQQVTPDSGGYHFRYGIWWCDEVSKKAAAVKQARTLIDKLAKEGFKSNNWWIGRKDTKLVPRGKDFMLRMVTNKQALVDEMAQLLWELFQDNCASIEAANLALARVK